MLARAENIRKITNYLAILSREVEINSSLNLLDINVQAESFYRDLLNLCYGFNLINTNSVKQNYQAIDLADAQRKIAVQVTSTSDLSKIKKTVDGFIRTKMYEDYERLIILNITEKKNHKIKEYGEQNIFVISLKDDVWDYKDIIRKINDLNDTEITSIHSFLERNITTGNIQKPPKEVTTMFAMIELLSDDDHPLAGNGFIEEPNPENKIYKRFSDYSDQLTSLYVGLAPLYSGIFTSIKEQSDIGTVKYRKMSLFLESFSDKILNDFDEDPILALNAMKDYFSSQLSQRNVDYDDSAIKFFLMANLIACNIFPNTEIL